MCITTHTYTIYTNPITPTIDAATRPAHVQVADITIYPTNQCGPKDIARVGESLGAPK